MSQNYKFPEAEDWQQKYKKKKTQTAKNTLTQKGKTPNQTKTSQQNKPKSNQ